MTHQNLFLREMIGKLGVCNMFALLVECLKVSHKLNDVETLFKADILKTNVIAHLCRKQKDACQYVV